MIIDAHSHIGDDFYFGSSKVQDYDKFCVVNNITTGLLMPMPWPIFKEDNIHKCSLIWEYENNDFKYYKVWKDNGILIKEPVYKNPYEIVNYNCYNKIKNYNSKTKIFFVPLIHGKLDDTVYLEKMIKDLNPVALKFHGFSSGFFETDVNKELIEIIKKYDLPIIFHTSVYKYNDGYGYDTRYFRNKCSPINWYEFIIENNIRGVLNHGACLDYEVLSYINKSDNIMVGLGPDFDISNDPYKVSIDKEEFNKMGYLNILKEKLDPEKILFDIDYNWNLGLNNKLDNGSVSRIFETWNYSDSEKILYSNAKKFYKL